MISSEDFVQHPASSGAKVELALCAGPRRLSCCRRRCAACRDSSIGTQAGGLNSRVPCWGTPRNAKGLLAYARSLRDSFTQSWHDIPQFLQFWQRYTEPSLLPVM
ncbi:hypothetical protein HGRIS_008857 [Hohenbuehelia grisea]|uniref:Uncharacterized protein n=1 Tax=Hohenbuehelia grisea TaxID=104357 RepID=A0ABR3IZG8_9AGAR